jgi:hypothetical protein
MNTTETLADLQDEAPPSNPQSPAEDSPVELDAADLEFVAGGCVGGGAVRD